MDEQEQEENRFRQLLEDGEEKSQQQYDKTLLQLNAGALGVSFAFLNDILGPQPWVCRTLLLLAWMSWAASMCSALLSFYVSVFSMRKEIAILDSRSEARNWQGVLVDICNAAAGILFVVGIVLLSVFVFMNL